MIELFITSEDFFSVYFKDLNVPIAYIILTLSIFFICYHKKINPLRSFFLWIFSGFGLAGLLDVIYDYTVKIFILKNMGIGEGLLFLLFPVGVYALIFYMHKYGDKKRMIMLIAPITFEIWVSFQNYDLSAIIRYYYVFAFIYIILGLKSKIYIQDK